MTRPVITTLPAAPTRGEDAPTFAAKANTFLAALPDFGTQSNSLGVYFEDTADDASDSAAASAASAALSNTAKTAAQAAQAAAESASNATQWVSGQAYVAGNVVWSPSSYLSYRATGATSGTVDPSQSASWVLLAADVPRFTNPLQLASRVAMTAAASGSRGWLVQNNPQVNFGTGDHGLHFELRLPSYTPSADQVVAFRFVAVDRLALVYVTTGKKLRYAVRLPAGFVFNVTTTASIPVSDGDACEIDIDVQRETASSAGVVRFSCNGVEFDSVALTAGTPTSIDMTSPWYFMGTQSARTQGEMSEVIMFNRFRSAPEVLSLCINGVDPADTVTPNLAVTVSNPDFADSTGWVTAGGGSTAAFVSGGEITLGTGTSVNAFTNVGSIPAGGRVFMRIKFRSSGSAIIPSVRLATDNFGANSLTLYEGALASYGSQTIEVTAVNTTRSRNLLWLREQNGVGGQFIVDEVQIQSVGITAQYNAQDAQSNTGQVFDSSGNGNHALLPPTGATVLPRKLSGEVRWTNTWDGTHELQYIGGTNQAILPANAYIESIVGTVSGATPHDIIIGDGSDTDRYVTITTGLAAGTTTFTLANRTPSGNNLKLTVDPDTNATMSIAFTIKYSYLETV